MTSATEELRAMLDEAGVEYETDDGEFALETKWNGATAFQLGPNANMLMAVTPAQAIAATLGSDRLQADLDITLKRYIRRGSFIAKQRERIAVLGQLVRDYASLCGGKCEWCDYIDEGEQGYMGCKLSARAAELGIEVD